MRAVIDQISSRAKRESGAVGMMLLSAGACSFSFRSSASPRTSPRSTGSIAPKAAPRRCRPISTKRIGGGPRRRWRSRSIPRAPGRWCRGTIPTRRMKGQFTPTGAPFVKNDEICRAFLAQLSGPGAPSALQGTACRPSGGDWAINDVEAARSPGRLNGQALVSWPSTRLACMTQPRALQTATLFPYGRQCGGCVVMLICHIPTANG